MKRIVSVILLAALLLSMSVPAMAAKKIDPCKSYSYGDRGTIITTIHKRLKAWGYGATTGSKFTDDTEYWVKIFQRANGLAVTGVDA